MLVSDVSVKKILAFGAPCRAMLTRANMTIRGAASAPMKALLRRSCFKAALRASLIPARVSITLSTWLKEVFHGEIEKERQLLEQYKRVGRDGLMAGAPWRRRGLE